MTGGKIIEGLDGNAFSREFARSIRNKEVIIFPSEAIYVVGFDFFDERSHKRVSDIKGRSPLKRFPVFLPSAGWLGRLGIIPNDLEKKFMDRYWPGQLVIAFSNDVMAKVPETPLLRNAIRQAGTILGVSSANKSGGPEVRRAKDLDKDLIKEVDKVFTNDDRLTFGGATFVRLKGTMEILRQGSLRVENLAQ